ncbi:hypothetical protein B0H14DRAFT_3441495 [Mycena olivaceomarginata]|nr:hypothetical protein B0H14DRAFT_3441495 [Mycena olivaceomarginata]
MAAPFDDDLAALLTAINNLPGSYQIARQWEHVFQKLPTDPDDELTTLVRRGRGRNGLILAHDWAAHYATVVTAGEKNLIQLRVQTLLRLIAETVPSEDGVAPTSEGDEVHDEGDEDRTMASRNRKKATKDKPKKKPKNTMGGSSDDAEQPKTRPTAKSKAKPKAKSAAPDKSDSSSGSSESEKETAEDFASVKLTWAISQYRKPIKFEKGAATLWKFVCRYCP